METKHLKSKINAYGNKISNRNMEPNLENKSHRSKFMHMSMKSQNRSHRSKLMHINMKSQIKIDTYVNEIS